MLIFYIHDDHNGSIVRWNYVIHADDLMLYRPIYSAIDYHLLQMDVNNICVWSDDNPLKFNGRKCKYMIISRRK